MMEEYEKYEAQIKEYQASMKRYEIWLDEFKYSMSHAIDFASIAIRSILILNGGAAISFLTFIGHMYAKNDKLPDELASSLLYFGWGAFCSVLTAGMGYFSQFHYAQCANEEDKKYNFYRNMGTIYHTIAITAGLLGAGLFIFGMYAFVYAFEQIS